MSRTVLVLTNQSPCPNTTGHISSWVWSLVGQAFPLLSQAAKYPALSGMGLDALYECQPEWHRAWADNFSQYLKSKGKGSLSESEFLWPLDLMADL